MELSPLVVLSLASATAAAIIIINFLVRRPVLDLRAKLWLLMGLGVFPALTAGTSTVAGMEATTERQFCGSCHVMSAHFDDSSNPESQSLAARHSRNPFFGGHACYVCHADYEMFGYLLTKAGGMRHVYEYYLGGYRNMTLDEAKVAIKLRKPYDNNNCRQCHTSTLHDWRRVPEHEALAAQLATNQVSCASAGCHGYAHPFTKTDSAPDVNPFQDKLPTPAASASPMSPPGMPGASPSAVPSASAAPSSTVPTEMKP